MVEKRQNRKWKLFSAQLVLNTIAIAPFHQWRTWNMNAYVDECEFYCMFFIQIYCMLWFFSRMLDFVFFLLLLHIKCHHTDSFGCEHSPPFSIFYIRIHDTFASAKLYMNVDRTNKKEDIYVAQRSKWEREKSVENSIIIIITSHFMVTNSCHS